MTTEFGFAIRIKGKFYEFVSYEEYLEYVALNHEGDDDGE